MNSLSKLQSNAIFLVVVIVMVACSRKPEECATVPKKVRAGEDFTVTDCSERAETHEYAIVTKRHTQNTPTGGWDTVFATNERNFITQLPARYYKLFHTVSNKHGSQQSKYGLPVYLPRLLKAELTEISDNITSKNYKSHVFRMFCKGFEQPYGTVLNFDIDEKAFFAPYIYGNCYSGDGLGGSLVCCFHYLDENQPEFSLYASFWGSEDSSNTNDTVSVTLYPTQQIDFSETLSYSNLEFTDGTYSLFVNMEFENAAGCP